MSARTLDAGQVAARMTARPLGADTDGGVWLPAYVPDAFEEYCESCGKRLSEHTVACAVAALCLPCAVADCERAEADAAQREHAAADPHCTCPDCLTTHAAHLEG